MSITIILLSMMNILSDEYPIRHQKEIFEIDLLEDEEVELIKKDDLDKLGIKIETHIPKNKMNKRIFTPRRRHYLPFDLIYEENEDKTGNGNLKRLKRETNKEIQSTALDFYNYEELKKEYYEEIEKENKEMNETAHLGPEKKHNKLKESIDIVTDVKVPKNCTDSDRTGYGLRSMECVFKDLFEKGFTRPVTNHFRKIVLFWFFCYLIVAVPLWLIKGWCCCCCRCKFCFPNVILHEVKEYVVKNPPGVEMLKDGTTKTYEPSDYEISTFQSLEISAFKVY